MEPNGWIKLWRKTRYDSKVRALGDSEFRLWVNLLMLASHEKKTVGQIVNEADGGALSVGQIAVEVGLPKTVTYRGLMRLCELGLCQREPLPFDRQGHLYRIPKFSRYQQGDNRSATGTVLSVHGLNTVPQTVPETVPPAERFAEQSGVPPAERLQSDMPEPSEEQDHPHRSATGIEPSGRSREVEKVRQRQRKAADADKPRGGEHAALTDRAWTALGLPGKPDGKLYGFTGKRKKGTGLKLFADWVNHLERAGPDEPFDPTADETDWFQRAFNFAMACKPGQGWRKSGTQGKGEAEWERQYREQTSTRPPNEF